MKSRKFLSTRPGLAIVFSTLLYIPAFGQDQVSNLHEDRQSIFSKADPFQDVTLKYIKTGKGNHYKKFHIDSRGRRHKVSQYKEDAIETLVKHTRDLMKGEITNLPGVLYVSMDYSESELNDETIRVNKTTGDIIR